GQPFGPPPPGVVVRPDRGYYENAAPWDSFAPRFGFACPEAIRAAWLYAAATGGSTSLRAIGEMRKARRRRIFSPWPNSSVGREQAIIRRRCKRHSRLRPWGLHHERPPQTWGTGLRDRTSGFPNCNNGT